MAALYALLLATVDLIVVKRLQTAIVYYYSLLTTQKFINELNVELH